MARTQFSITTYNKKYDKAVAKHAANRLSAIFDAFYKEAAKIAAASGFNSPDKEFYLRDFPKTEAKVDALLSQLSGRIEDVVRDGNSAAWQLSYEKNNDMVRDLAQRFGISEQIVAEWSRRNMDGLQAFQERVVQGMNLSERVWNFVKSDKGKLELAMELGLSEGKSAAALSRDVRSYLQEPNKLFRRVRDKDGNLRLSKAAAAYHPGRGVYRSSYKNALRMTMTENNMAYRTSDYEAWNKMPFVTGIIVRLSGTHPEEDICDELSNKEYPKEFKFVGWHPQCRCYVIAKRASQEDMDEYLSLPLNEREGYEFGGRVTDMPKEFDAWLANNAERIATAKNMPYFIKDNYVGGNVANGLRFKQTPDDLPIIGEPLRQGRTPEQILEAARARQAARTPEQIQDIQDRWALREDELQYSPEQRAMFRVLEQQLGIKRGFSMPYLRADDQHANPNYGKAEGYDINCQTCAPAYQLRRWGFDVTAKPRTEGSLLSELARLDRWDEIWLSAATGKRKGNYPFADFARKKGWDGYTAKRYEQYFEACCKNDGIYEIAVAWKRRGYHATIVERRNGKLYYVEPQLSNAVGSGMEWDDFKNLCKSMTSQPPQLYFGAVRTDNAIIDLSKFASIFEKGKQPLTLHQQRIANAAAERHALRTTKEVNDIKAAWKESRRISKERERIAKYREELANIDNLEELRDSRALWGGSDKVIRRLYIDRAAEIRHAQRNAAEIQKTWDNRKVIRKAAENVAKVARNTPWIDATAIDSLSSIRDLTQLDKATRALAKEVAAVNKKLREYEEIIPDVKKWANTYSQAEIEGVYNSVKVKIAKIENDALNTYKYTTHLEQEIAKYKFEIFDYLEGNMNGVQQKYPAWKVSHAAYSKQLAKVELKIKEQKAAQTLADYKLHAQKFAKSAIFVRMVDEAEALLAAGKLDEFEAKIYEAEKKRKKLESDRKRNAKKARKSASNGKIYDGGVPYTDDELEEIDRLEEKMLDAIRGITVKSTFDYYDFTDVCDEYADYIHSLGMKYYNKQLSILSAAEQKRLAGIMDDYLQETAINPNWVFGNVLGGEYNSMKSARAAMAQSLGGNISAAELSLATRFTNGMTFYNAYNLKDKSTYWEGVWARKMAMLNPTEQKEIERRCAEYTEALTTTTDRLQRYDGIVFRGVTGDGAVELRKQFEECWAKGSSWTNNAAASSSTDLRVSRGFDSGSNGLIMIIKNKTGGNIRSISEYNGEREVLLIKDRKYKLTCAPYQKNGRTWVELEEII